MTSLRRLAYLAGLFLILLSPTTLRAQASEKDLIRDLVDAQRQPGLTAEAVATRRTAIAALRGSSSEKIAKALVAAYEQSERERDQLRARVLEIQDERAQLVKGQDPQNVRLPQAQLDQLNALRAEEPKVAAIVEAHVLLQGLIRELVAELEGTETWDFLVNDVLPSKRLPLPIRLAAADSLAGAASNEEVAKDLVRRLSRAKRSSDIVVMTQAVAALGATAAGAASELLDLLEHDEAIVRDRAARALAALQVVEAVEPMIELLEKHGRDDARHAAQIAGSLKALTGQEHGVVASIWRAWWKDNKDAFLAGDAPLGGGVFELPEVKSAGYYFDIPQDGKSIFYVIDSSGSMEAEIDVKLPSSEDAEGKVNRLEACKRELISAIRRLDKDQEFNIIWYSSEIHPWNDRMKAATPTNVRNAVEWVETLQPLGSTNIYGALQKTFEFVGQGARDKYYDIAFDTLFLLTDGTPTLPDGSIDSTDKILTATDGWNALRRVRLHCIGIGRGVNRPFLETLAKRNGGLYRSY